MKNPITSNSVREHDNSEFVKEPSDFDSTKEYDSDSTNESKNSNLEVVQSTPEYPNGNVVYEMPLQATSTLQDLRNVGWCTLVYASHKSKKGIITTKKSCLGVYQCPTTKCNFVERAKLPEVRTKNALPRPTSTTCSHHHKRLVHMPCSCTMTFVTGSDTIRLQHFGWHRHNRPHPIRPDVQGRNKLYDIIRTAPEVVPKRLQVGTKTRPPVTELHPSLFNLDRLAYHRTKLLKKETTRSTWGSIANFEKSMNIRCMVSSSMREEDGHITVQTPFMKERLMARESSLQTDSVEGFIVDDNCPAINLAITSGHCLLLSRHVPLLISILIGKTANHYECHFRSLFTTLNLPPELAKWSSGDNAFPGNTCDFSDAERFGFEQALRAHCAIPTDKSLELNKHFRCCQVHFKRTLTRVARNSALVPPLKETEFYNAVSQLLSIKDGTQFKTSVDSLYQEYPKIKRWLQWYMARSEFIFPAMTQNDLSHMSCDTNAQESVGADIQRTAPKRELSIAETLEHLVRYTNSVQCDFSQALLGAPLRYQKPTRKRKYVNDGRPPDTTRQLNKRMGRPKGSRNIVPKLAGDIDMSTFGIPWGVRYGEFKADNTCAIDSTLMPLYFLRTHGCLNTTATPNCGILSSVMNLIKEKKYHEARFVWYTEVLQVRKIGFYSQFMSIHQALGSGLLTDLFRFRIRRASRCNSEFCTNGNKVVDEHLDCAYVPVGCSQVTQASLQEFFGPNQDPCTEHVRNIPPGAPTESYRKEILPEFVLGIKDKLEEKQKEVWTCRGMREKESSEVLDFPLLLMIQVVVGGQPMYEKPALRIHLGRCEYKLATIIYTNEGRDHFFCHIFVQERPIFYDGLKSKKCQWMSLPMYEKSKFPISQVWYERCGSDST